MPVIYISFISSALQHDTAIAFCSLHRRHHEILSQQKKEPLQFPKTGFSSPSATSVQRVTSCVSAPCTRYPAPVVTSRDQVTAAVTTMARTGRCALGAPTPSSSRTAPASTVPRRQSRRIRHRRTGVPEKKRKKKVDPVGAARCPSFVFLWFYP